MNEKELSQFIFVLTLMEYNGEALKQLRIERHNMEWEMIISQLKAYLNLIESAYNMKFSNDYTNKLD